MRQWALDVGTTNTAVAGWNVQEERAVMHVMPAIGRPDAPGIVPTATHMAKGEDLWTSLGRMPWIRERAFWGRHAWIGTQAMDRNISRVHPAYAPSFKPHLQHQPVRPLARLGRRVYSAREVAGAFLRELMAEVQRTSGRRPQEVTVTSPVDAYEGYRAELARALRRLGVSTIHFVDEPVAAAVGYGVSVRRARRVLVVDFGGGTLDLALVEVDARALKDGRARVVAKAARPVGGRLVDRWLLRRVCDELDAPIPADAFWRRLLLDEAERVKEELLLRAREPFHLRPPGPRVGKVREHLVSREALVDVLQSHGLYETLESCTEEVLEQARTDGDATVDDVLMVGGSTLLPGVFTWFEDAFGRDRVRAWQPFEAAALGACTLAGRGFVPDDYIVHDYAILVSDPDSTAQRPATIVPAGTRFPTPPDLWRGRMVPTCPFGEPERVYKLVVCEIGRAHGAERSFGWDDDGRLHELDDGGLVVPLNKTNPTMGFLDPPHHPSDKSARLEVQFGVDADRWLTATVTDLKTRRRLLKAEPVVRLL